jgi:hypothetical protein
MSDCVRRHSGCVVRRSRLSVFRHKPEGRDHSLRRASAGGRARAPAQWRCRCGFIGCTRALDLRAVRATTGDPLRQYVALAVETVRQFGRNSGSGLVPRSTIGSPVRLAALFRWLPSTRFAVRRCPRQSVWPRGTALSDGELSCVSLCARPERDDFSSNRHPAPALRRCMIFSGNRSPLFAITL